MRFVQPRVFRGSKNVAAIRRGKSIACLLFRVIGERRQGGRATTVVVVSKKVDKRAVVRNQLRRRIREWIRQRPDAFSFPLDLVFIVKKEATRASRTELYEELNHAIFRLAQLLDRG